MLVSLADLAVSVPAIIGAASLMVKAAGLIAGITPSKRDDELVGRIERALGLVVRVADRVALNPPAEKARPQ